MQTSDDIIVIEHLNKSYGKTQILQDLNLRVARGEFVAIVGPSGSGKSTLLHILGSIDRPSSGTVIVDGEDLNAISSKRIAKFRNQSIGFVFQFFYLQPHMTIAENLTVPMMPMRIPRNLRQQRIQTAAATVNIANKLNSYPKSLSGGELQRAAIARAIINQPKLILADEATGNLDDNNTMNIVRLLLNIKQQSHTTIVMVTHDMRIAQMADRTLYLKNGSISYAQN